MENPMHRANIISTQYSSSENIEMKQPQHLLDEEPEKETVSLAPAQPNSEQNNEVIYEIVKTTMNNVPLTILVDSGAASSHITEKAVKDTKSRYGNVESEIINSFTILNLAGIGGETIDVPFNINRNQILSSIPGYPKQFSMITHI